jgi:hypothetical protein
MTRFIYRALLALHPPGFRSAFGNEMLCVFDEATVDQETAGFCGDAALSLVRHWARSPMLWTILGALVGSLTTLSSGASMGLHIFLRPLGRQPVSPEGLVLITGGVLVAISATTVFAVRVFLSLRRRI